MQPSRPRAAARPARRAPPIEWDPHGLRASRIDGEVARVLHVATVLEEDTAVSARQARSLGLDRDPALAAFLGWWELEEAKHALALHHLLDAQPFDPPPLRPGVPTARRRSVAGVPLSPLWRIPATGLVFCAMGAAAEYVALVIYTELARRTDDPRAHSLLRQIIRQEGSHLACFRAAAVERGDAMSARQGRLARGVMRRFWQPVGLPSLGSANWHTALGPLIDDPDVRRRVVLMDRVLDGIPHLEGLGLMAGFLHPTRAAVG